jgi:hypothetical protein
VKRPSKYPKLTPLRAFELLRELDHGAGVRDAANGAQPNQHTVNRARAELADHVRAAIVRGSR